MDFAERQALRRELKLRPPGEDPEKPFFLAVSIGNDDDTLSDLGGEGCEGIFGTEDEAVSALRDLNASYAGLEGYVYHCVPVRRVWRGPVKVTAVKPDRAAPKKARGK